MSANPLEIYARELRRWSKAVNLVSPATLAELETRHIADSLQLTQYLPDHPITLVDWGSGAGLPGMILALQRLDDTVHLIESDNKKAEFLKHVSRETGRSVLVHNVRLEDVHLDTSYVHVVTARALAPLKTLLKWLCTYQKTYPQLYALFPKGKLWEKELTDAQELFNFKVIVYNSDTDSQGRILRIERLTER